MPKLTAFPRDQKTDTARSGMKSSNDDAIVQAPSDLIAHLVAENASKRLDGSSMNELLALIGTEAALWSVRRATIPRLSSRQFPLLWVYRLAPFDTSAPEGLFVASASTTILALI